MPHPVGGHPRGDDGTLIRSLGMEGSDATAQWKLSSRESTRKSGTRREHTPPPTVPSLGFPAGGGMGSVRVKKPPSALHRAAKSDAGAASSRDNTELTLREDSVTASRATASPSPPPTTESSTPSLPALVTCHSARSCDGARGSEGGLLAPSVSSSPVVLPSSLLSAHVPFLLCCREWSIDPGARDWNDEFQTLWAEMLEIQTRSSTGYVERVRVLLREFEAYCQELVDRVLAEGNWKGGLEAMEAPESAMRGGGRGTAPSNFARAPLAAMGCSRYGNVVLRVWRDAKLAQNMQRCFAAFMETRSPWLFAPLTATFRRLNIGISVQALVPIRSRVGCGGVGMGAGPGELPIVHRGDGLPDDALHEPTRQALDFVVGALNLLPTYGPSTETGDAGSGASGEEAATPHDLRSQQQLGEGGEPPEGCSAQRKIIGVEVVEGLDERLYVMNPLGLVPPLAVPTHRAVPLRRWLHMVRHPPQHIGECVAPAHLYQADIQGAHTLLAPALHVVEHRRGERLVELLHAHGLNVCLLGHIALSLHLTPKEDVSASHEPLFRLVATEMLARTVRAVMFQQMSLDSSPGTLRVVSAYLTRTVASLIDPPPDRFVDGLLPHIAQMFLLDTPATRTPPLKNCCSPSNGVGTDAAKKGASCRGNSSSSSGSLASEVGNGGEQPSEGMVMLLAAPLSAVLRECTVPIVQRMCQLSGLQMLRGTVSAVLSLPSTHNYSSLLTPHHEELLASFFLEGSTAAATTATTMDAEGVAGEAVAIDAAVAPATSSLFTVCFVRPHRADFLGRSGRQRACLAELQRLVEEAGTVLQHHPFVNAHFWCCTGAVAATCGQRRDALMLADKACRVMEELPVYTSVGAAHRRRLPAHTHFLRGRVKAHIMRGYILCLLGRFADAESSLERSLRCADVLGVDEMRSAAHLRLEAMLGFFEVARASDSVEHIARIDRRWEAERRSLPPTQLGTYISEVLGSLLLERGAFALAAVRLWECFETLQRVRGERAYAVAEVLNKVAFAYYSWDAGRYGLYSSCMLRQAEEITVETCGMFSPQHICVIENIIALLIRRARFVEASQLVHMLKTLPPRYALRVPRDHPVAIRLPELEAKLREEFEPVAVIIIQRCWREYTNKMLVRAVCEASAKEIQRAGRGLLVRRELSTLHRLALRRKLSEQARQRRIEEIRLRQHIPVMLSFSKPLINAAVHFSKDCRNFNSEYQQVRLFRMWWDVVDGSEQRTTLDRLESEFVAAAEHHAAAAHRDPSLAQPLLDCSTSFVVDNIVFTRIARGSQLPHLQNALLKAVRQVPQQMFTATLSAIVDDPGAAETELYAEALIPLDRRPQFVMLSDGREGSQASTATRVLVDHTMRPFRQAGLAPQAPPSSSTGSGPGAVAAGGEDGDRGGGAPSPIQGVEVVRGLDEQYYFTNMLGLVFNVIQRHTSGWTLPRSHMEATVQDCLSGKAKAATEELEKVLISNYSLAPVMRSYIYLLLACTRFAAGLDRPTTHRYFQLASTELEEAGLFRDALLSNYDEARCCIRDDAGKQAIAPLLRNFHLIREKIRLRPYFGSFFALESARWLLVASQMADRPFDEAALKVTVLAIENGEPSLLFFTTCERLIAYYRKAGNNATLDILQQLRQRRAQELSASESERYAQQLRKQSEEAFRRGGNESYRDCAVLLVTAIHLAEAKHEDTVLLASLLNLYGWLQTSLNNLKQAQKSLGKAHRILVKTESVSTPEMFMWRKNNRMLENRLRENAIRVIRRAVRRWKERRRLNRELQRSDPDEYAKVVQVQMVRRMNRLSVSEATQRVLITEAEGEGWYQLGRKQRRGRNEAILRQTYGSRVQLFVDKLSAAQASLTELAFSTKAAIEELYWATHVPLQATMLLTGHRLGRREVIAEWHADTAAMKLWHVEHVDEVIRVDFITAYHHYLLRCVSAEERAWRRVIVKLQKKTKKRLGRYISKSLRAKPKNATTDLRALLTQEEMARDRIYEDESDEFRGIDDDWAYGPEVKEEFSGTMGDH